MYIYIYFFLKDPHLSIRVYLHLQIRVTRISAEVSTAIQNFQKYEQNPQKT